MTPLPVPFPLSVFDLIFDFFVDFDILPYLFFLTFDPSSSKVNSDKIVNNNNNNNNNTKKCLALDLDCWIMSSHDVGVTGEEIEKEMGGGYRLDSELEGGMTEGG